jgi:hypothetical protein
MTPDDVRTIIDSVRRAAFVLAVVLVIGAAVATASNRLPGIAGEVRPAVFSNGDGSAITGGLDGTGRNKDFRSLGHIRWTTWSATEAVGWGVEWIRCIDYRGCPRAYTLQSKTLHRIRASRPANGIFTRVVDWRVCWLWRGSGIGYYPVSCRTWRA